MNKRPNIILITADSLRADYCGFINHKRKHLTPFLNTLAKEVLVFKNAYANASYTPMSFPAIFTGKYPIFMGSPRVGVRITIPELLKLKKYKTMAFVASNLGLNIFLEVQGGLMYSIHFLQQKRLILTILT